MSSAFGPRDRVALHVEVAGLVQYRGDDSAGPHLERIARALDGGQCCRSDHSQAGRRGLSTGSHHGVAHMLVQLRQRGGAEDDLSVRLETVPGQNRWAHRGVGVHDECRNIVAVNDDLEDVRARPMGH